MDSHFSGGWNCHNQEEKVSMAESGSGHVHPVYASIFGPDIHMD